MKKYISIIILAVIILIIALPVFAEDEQSSIKAEIIKNNGVEEIKKEDNETQKIQKVTVRILEGEYENEEYDMEYIITEDIENITSNVELGENDKIKVALEEKEGEIINVNYVELITFNYTLYIVGGILLIILLIISRKRATLIYLLTIILTGAIITFCLQNGWDLILISSMLAALITVILFFSIKGINKDTIIMITRALIGIAISGVLIYILFDIMNLASINIKIIEKLVNIKDLICSATILFSCGIYNAIEISREYRFYATNKPYKTKSDNIIEGQRSLKL